MVERAQRLGGIAPERTSPMYAKETFRDIAERWDAAGKVPRERIKDLEGRMRKVEDLDLRLLGVVVSRNGEMIDTGAGAAAMRSISADGR